MCQKEGRQAFEEGKKVQACPYRKCISKRKNWFSGYYKAKAKHEKALVNNFLCELQTLCYKHNVTVDGKGYLSDQEFDFNV
jgi:ribosome modulation factor